MTGNGCWREGVIIFCNGVVFRVLRKKKEWFIWKRSEMIEGNERANKIIAWSIFI